MKYKVPKIFRTLCVSLVLASFASCFWLYDEGGESHHLGKGFWLWYFGDPKEQIIILGTDTLNPQEGRSIIIGKTVYAVGFNADFIIVKKHPNLEDSIHNRLWKPFEKGEDFFQLTSPDDSIYLSKDDKVYKKNGKWYHISNGWNPPDSVCPNRRITFYYIIDIRNYKFGSPSNFQTNPPAYVIYKLANKEDFDKKRQEIGVPNKLDFTLVKKEIE